MIPKYQTRLPRAFRSEWGGRHLGARPRRPPQFLDVAGEGLDVVQDLRGLDVPRAEHGLLDLVHTGPLA